MSNFSLRKRDLLIVYFCSIITLPGFGQTLPPEGAPPPASPPAPHRDLSGLNDPMVAPEALLRFQDEIDLTAEQRKKIRDLIKASETEAFDQKWKLDEAQRNLQKSLTQSPIDEALVKRHSESLGQADLVLKTNHLLLLVRLRNLLSPEQYQKIRAIRPPPPPMR